jgi:hypothetical protein
MENYFKLRKKWGGEKTGDRENRDTILIHQFFPEDEVKSAETEGACRGRGRNGGINERGKEAFY